MINTCTKAMITALVLGALCQNMQAAKKAVKKEKTSKKNTGLEDKVLQEYKKAAALHKELAKDPVLKDEARDHEELATAYSKLAKGAQGEEKQKALATIQEYRAKLGLVD